MRFAKSPVRRRAQAKSLLAALAALVNADSPEERQRSLAAAQAVSLGLASADRVVADYSSGRRKAVSFRRLLLNAVDALLELPLSVPELHALCDLIGQIELRLRARPGRSSRRWMKRYAQRLKRALQPPSDARALEILNRYYSWQIRVHTPDPDLQCELLRVLSSGTSWELRALAAQVLLANLERIFCEPYQMLVLDPAVRALPAAARDPDEVSVIVQLLAQVRRLLGPRLACESSLVKQTIEELVAPHCGRLPAEVLELLRC